MGVENLGGPPRSRNKTPLVSHIGIERSHDRVDEEARRDAQESGIEHNRLHQDEDLRLIADHQPPQSGYLEGHLDEQREEAPVAQRPSAPNSRFIVSDAT